MSIWNCDSCHIPGNGTCYSVGVLSRIEGAVSCKDHIEGSIIGPRARTPISTHLQTSVTLSARRWEIYSVLVKITNYSSICHCEAFFSCLQEGCRGLSTTQSSSWFLRNYRSKYYYSHLRRPNCPRPRGLLWSLIDAWLKGYLWRALLLNKSGDNLLASSKWNFCFVDTLQLLRNNIVITKIKGQYPLSISMI